MKKLISFLCLLMLTALSAWAKVATYNFSAEPEVSWPDGYFTHEGDWKFTSIEPALEYDDMSFSRGLDISMKSTKLHFTTTRVATVTIVQSNYIMDYTAMAGFLLFDGKRLDPRNADITSDCRIFTLSDVSPGEHTLSFGNGESYLFYVEVAEAESPDDYTPYDGTVYLVDAESGQYMAAGNEWETHAIINATGLDLTLTTNPVTNKVVIDTRISQSADQHYFGSNLFMDSDAFEWGLVAQDDGFFITNDGSRFIGIDASNNLQFSRTPHKWMLVPAADRKAELLESLAVATASNPKDATFLLQCPGFNRHDTRGGAWQVSEDCTNSNLSGGNNVNNCAESNHSPFTISQTLDASAPRGTYLLTIQGFYRQDDGVTEDAPQFFIGDATATIPLMTGAEKSMSDASASFTEGRYTLQPITFFYNGRDSLTVGVSGTAEHQWVCFDNFQLTYLGETLVTPPDGVDMSSWMLKGTFRNHDGDQESNYQTQVAFHGTDVYVQGLAYFFRDAWLRGKLDTETGYVTFPSGQLVGVGSDRREYMIGSEDGKTVCDIVFQYDAVAKKLTQVTALIEENPNPTTEGGSFGYWKNCVYFKVSAEDSLVTLPDGVEAKTWTLRGAIYSGGYTDVERQTHVAFDGTDVYAQGLSYLFPDAWLKGTLDPETSLVTFPTGQFVGEDKTGKIYMLGSIDGDTICDIVFSYDELAQKLTSTHFIVENEGTSKKFDAFAIWTYCVYTEGAYDLATLPDGVKAQTWTFKGNREDNGPIMYQQSETHVAFDGTEVYVQGLSHFFRDAWLKGTLDTETGLVTFPAGQFVGWFDRGNDFMLGSEDGETVCDIVYQYDAVAQRMTQVTPYIYESVATDHFQKYHGCWTSTVMEMPVEDSEIEAPEGLETETYYFMAQERMQNEDEWNAFSFQTQVGFDGKDVYFKGFTDYSSAFWARGRMSDDGKTVTIPASQYMGMEHVGSLDFYTYITAVDAENNFIDLVLNYDAETSTFTTDQLMALNGNKYLLDDYQLFKNVVITKMTDFAATPADPSIARFQPDGDNPLVEIDIPVVDTKDRLLVEDKLFYTLWYEKDGVQQQFTVLADNYMNVQENMVEIPFTFDDDYDIYSDRSGALLFLEPTDGDYTSWTDVGVQSIYYGGGERTTSNIVWLNKTVGIADVATGSDRNHAVYDLSGRRVTHPGKGIYIINGKKTVVK